MMIRLQKAVFLLGLVFLSSSQVGADDDYYDDDDGNPDGGRCYYDPECTWSCGDAQTAEDCLDYLPLNPGAIPFDAPFFKLNSDTSEGCGRTAPKPKAVGYCCDTCDGGVDRGFEARNGCHRVQLLNPDQCSLLDKTYVLNRIEAQVKGTSLASMCHVADDEENIYIYEEDDKEGSGSGDPHFKTWTGEKFDYHGECDLVLVDNPTFNNGQGLKVHIRTTRVKYFSYIERIAIQIGDDILEFANDAENFVLNGLAAEPNKKFHKTKIGGYIVRRDLKALSIRLSNATDGSYHNHHIAKIDLLVRSNGFPAVIVDAGNSNVFQGSLGLLGDWETGSKLGRDGETVFEVDRANAEHFALEWQVRDTEPMLFKESRFPQFPTKCTPPSKIMGARLGRSHMEKEAERACANFKGDKEDCIFDCIATRSITAASSE